jgi:two-component system CheB/CheR fusion protein
MPKKKDTEQKTASGESVNETTSKDFYIVGIGASAGGLEALESFFDNMPASQNLSFVIIQHLSPDYKSLMAELLTKHTTMEIFQVEDGTAIKPGAIYLIPRKNNMTIFKGTLFLTKKEDGLNLPIDIFFASLAEDQKERAVGIILSGTGSDGTRGVRSIKEAGGMIMVQNEDSAKFDGMPKSAISTGIADYVLPVEKMPEELVNFISGNIKLLNPQDFKSSSSNSLSKILLLVKRKTGVDLSFYKESTIVRRIERRMGINQIHDIERYAEFLEEYPNEILTLYKEILIGVTRFFRDPEAYTAVKNRIIPQIFNDKHKKDNIRIWIAGCSTGEEAYSLAMLFADYNESNELHHEIKIFATDIDKSAIEFASYGVYPESIAADVSRYYLGKYFVKKGEKFQVKPNLREMVIFAYHNVFKDPPFRRIDLISCRNLLIYLQPVLQKKIMSNFHFSLNQKGFLLLGSSETVGENSKYFSSFDPKWKIYSYKGGAKPRERPMELPAEVKGRLSIEDSVKPQYNRQLPKEFENIYEKLIESWFPPCALINEHREIIHIFGETEDFLRLPVGRMDLDILKMAKQSISIPLGTALQKAIKENTPVKFEGISVSSGNGNYPINISVLPLKSGMESRHFTVIFQRKEDISGDEIQAEPFSLEENVQKRIEDLENELQYSKENLQATIEELETSNEELQATNEELLSSNEELQSTNEELQSVNEELITVNSEYQKKIEELSDLNDDMDNLLASTDIGTIFLDENLIIRKYTPPVVHQINIIKSDLGRPLSDLSHKLKYPSFIEDIKKVMEGGDPHETEVQNNQENWLLVKIQPYNSESSRIQGTVISFIDITRQKSAELALMRNQELLMGILESSPSATTMVNEKGRIIFTNGRGEEILGIKRNDLSKMSYNDPNFKITDEEGNTIPEEELPFSRLLKTKEPVDGYVHYIERPDGVRKKIKINGNPMFDENGNIQGAVFSLEEV